MNVYFRCSDCHAKHKVVTNSFNPPPCEKCGSSKIDLNIGSKPDWWTNDDERRHQEKAP